MITKFFQNRILCTVAIMLPQILLVDISLAQSDGPKVNSQYYACNLEPVVECHYRSPLSEPDYDPLGTGPLQQWQVETLLTNAYNQLFTPGDHNNRLVDDDPILYNYGSNEAYILDVANDDVRSEGMSYGMMIALQMGDQATFDKLWRFSKNRLRQPNGQFAWQWSPSTESTLSTGAAPDGEEYMAMALFFAHYRWGNNTDMNYLNEANTILDVIRTAFFNNSNYQIKFIDSANYTDPSYHLPAFYELWALWASSATNRDFYKNAAVASRDFFKNAAHPQTGLFTEYMNFNGTPTSPDTNGNANSGRFAYDSWRVIQNMAMDYHWWSRDEELKELVERMQTFFRDQGLDSYKARYEYNGGSVDGAEDANAGIRWMNAVGSLVGRGWESSLSFDFIGDFVDDAPRTDQYRYYDGLLQMFGLLHLSGHYRIWGPNGSGAESSDMNINTWTPSLRIVTINNATESTLNDFSARYFFTAENNKTPIITASSTNNAQLSLEQLGNNIWAVNLDYNGYALPSGESASGAEMFSLAYTDGSNFDNKADFTIEKIEVADRFAIYNGSGNIVQGSEPNGINDIGFTGEASLKNVWSNNVLTATGQNDDAQTRCQTQNSSWTSQDWLIEKVNGSSHVRLKNKWTGKYLNVQSNQENAKVVNYHLVPSWGSQQWIIEAVPGKSSVRLKNAWSGKYLTAVDTSNYAEVITKDLRTDWISQEWILQ